jgi:hypothetical protein
MNVIHAAQAGQGGPVTIACINKATVDLGVPPRYAAFNQSSSPRFRLSSRLQQGGHEGARLHHRAAVVAAAFGLEVQCTACCPVLSHAKELGSKSGSKL